MTGTTLVSNPSSHARASAPSSRGTTPSHTPHAHLRNPDLCPCSCNRANGKSRWPDNVGRLDVYQGVDSPCRMPRNQQSPHESCKNRETLRFTFTKKNFVIGTVCCYETKITNKSETDGTRTKSFASSWGPASRQKLPQILHRWVHSASKDSDPVALVVLAAQQLATFSVAEIAVSSKLATPNDLSVPSASEGKFGLKSVILQHQNAHLLLNVEDLILPNSLSSSCMGLQIRDLAKSLFNRKMSQHAFYSKLSLNCNGKVWVC